MSETPAPTRVLMVDDEPNVLAGFRRTVGRKYELVTATSGGEALEIMRSRPPFAVVITDMHMPGMTGIEFLANARAINSDTVYAMLTGNADQQTAIDAINRGHIFRFLSKPCPPLLLDHTIRLCARQYELVSGEKLLLKQTLSGVVRLLVESMTASDPELGGAIEQLRLDTREFAEELGVAADWRLPLAASLCLLGAMTTPIPPAGRDWSDDALQHSAEAGARLLRHIPRIEDVAAIIARQRARLPLPPEQDRQTTGRLDTHACILRFCVDWHVETRNAGGDRRRALLLLGSRAAGHDACLFDIGLRILERTRATPPPRRAVTMVPAVALREGMVVAEDVRAHEGNTLASRGETLTADSAERLRALAASGDVDPSVPIRALAA